MGINPAEVEQYQSHSMLTPPAVGANPIPRAASRFSHAIARLSSFKSGVSFSKQR